MIIVNVKFSVRKLNSSFLPVKGDTNRYICIFQHNKDKYYNCFRKINK